MQVDTILFDLDGTMVDSVPDIAAALNGMLKQLKIKEISLTDTRNIVGKGFPTTVRKVLELQLTSQEAEQLQKEAFSLTLKHYDENAGKETTIFPQVRKTLIKLKSLGFKMAVVTNKEEKHAKELLQRLDLVNFFNLIIGGDTTAHYKPHPESVYYALKILNSKPNSSILVGDSKTDIELARNANIRVIGVSYGYNYGRKIQEDKPDYVVDEFSELPQLIASIY